MGAHKFLLHARCDFADGRIDFYCVEPNAAGKLDDRHKVFEMQYSNDQLHWVMRTEKCEFDKITTSF